MEKILDKIERVVLASSLLIMVAIAFANVISRKVLHASWSFTEEITSNLFILSSLVGASMAARKGSHLGLSLVTDLIPKNKQKYVMLVQAIAAIVLCAFLFKEGIAVAVVEKVNNQRTPALGWPEWIFGTFVPLGCFLIAVSYILRTINLFRTREEDGGEV